MKVIEIINNPVQEQQEIDWSVPMWVKSTNHEDLIVMSVGGVVNNTKNQFTGTCLPCKLYPNGDYSHHWDKDKFKPLQGSLTIKISN